jgi:phage baseplate assembly protein W
MDSILSKLRILDDQGNEITMASVSAVDFGAVSHKEIVQNLRCILLTPQYSVPLNRLLGMEYLFLDMPINQQRDILVAEILEKISIWENRLEVLDVDFSPDAATLEGQTMPVLHVRVHDVTYTDRLPYRDYLKGPSYG